MDKKEKIGKKNRLMQYGVLIVALIMIVSSGVYATIYLSEPSGSNPGNYGFDNYIKNGNGELYTFTAANIRNAIVSDMDDGHVSIELPAGTISYSTTINCSVENITIKGKGVGVTVLEYSGVNRALLFEENDCKYVHVSDLTLKYTGVLEGDSRPNGIRCDSVTGFIVLDNLHVEGFQIGLFLGGTAPPNTGLESRNIIIKNNLIEGCSRSGIEYGHAHNSIITGNILNDNNRGIYILSSDSNRSDYHIISKNIITNCTSIGNYSIYVAPVYDVIIKDNIVNCGDTVKGIGASYSHNVTIKNNIIRLAYEYGIYCNDNYNTRIIGNELFDIQDNSQGAIVVAQNINMLEIKNNIIDTMDKYGIWLRSGSLDYMNNVKVEGNTIVDAGSMAIFIDEVQNFTCKNNYINDFRVNMWASSAIQCEDSKYGDISNNYILKYGGTNTDYAIYLVRTNSSRISDNWIQYDGYTKGMVNETTCANNNITGNFNPT